MPAAMRYQGNLNRSQIEELAKKYPNANISTEWVNLFIKGLLKDAIEGDLKIDEKKKSTKELLEEQRLKNLRKTGAILDLTIWEKAKNGNIALSITQLVEIGNGTFTIPMPDNQVKPTEQPKPTTEKLRENQFKDTANNIPISIWDEAENQFVCFDCNPHSKFEYRLGVIPEMINVVSDYSEHVIKQHNRNLTDNEKQIINEYLDIVNKSIAPTNAHFDELKQSMEKNKLG